jgi:xylulokinase
MLHLKPGIPISYRAGDQPNNALSLNVLEPGQLAATAGTSGVIYGVTDQLKPDPLSRVNLFAHVTHEAEKNRLGVLLCLNGAGILNAWARKQMGDGLTYEFMNELASTAPVGSLGLAVLPFGNGAERLLQNQQVGCQVTGLDYNRHQRAHFFRACQEGVAFAMCYGMDVMQQLGVNADVIRANHSNLFLSPVFRQTLANCANVTIELSASDGATGAACGAAYGAGLVAQLSDCFTSQNLLDVVEPNAAQQSETAVAYDHWRGNLDRLTKEKML